MRRRIPRDTWIMLGALTAVVLLLTAAVYLPQARRMEDLQRQIAAEQSLLTSNEERAAVLPEVALRVERMKALYQELDRRIPERTELGGFLREISGHLNDEKMSSQLIEPGNPSREELFHTLPIIMRFQGSYLALADFLEQIDRMQRLARVQKLRIAATTEPTSLEIELQLNIYFTDTGKFTDGGKSG